MQRIQGLKEENVSKFWEALKEEIKLTKDQAEKKILTLKKDLFNIRFKKINNQIKKNIARLYTTIKNTK